MPNVASVLRVEMGRIARKELRGETEALKKSSARHRSDIAALKRQISILERQLAVLAKHSGATSAARAAPDESPATLRFRATGLASHRQRLGLSAREAAQIMGVSALSVYKWESGKSHPRRSQLEAIAAFRKLGKREAQEKLKA